MRYDQIVIEEFVQEVMRGRETIPFHQLREVAIILSKDYDIEEPELCCVSEGGKCEGSR